MNLSGLNSLMLAPRNTTTVGASPQLPSSNPIGRVQTRLSHTVLNTGSSPETLRHPSVDAMASSSQKNAEIPPPQLDCRFYASNPEFVNQADLDQRWTALKEYLTSATLQEKEIFEVLHSGVLQTDTGKAISGLFERAFIRSIRSRGSLSETRQNTIVDALCHLPPGQWQAAFGEQARFASEHRADGVTSFVQSRLDASSDKLRQQIADKLRLSNAQLDVIEELTSELRQYIRADNEGLFTAWDTLKQDCEMRSSPKDALEHLEALIAELRDPPIDGRKRWNDHVIQKVEAVRDQLKPDYQDDLTRPEKERPVELISLRFFNTPKPGLTGQAEFSLQSALQGFERHANFYTNVSTTGPQIPDGFIGKLLYACNALDTFGALRLDSAHISTAGPGPKPSANAWKNGESDFFRSPLTPEPEQPQAAAMDPLAGVGQFAAQVDELLNRFLRNAVPWDSAHAHEEVELEAMLESFGETPYQPTTTGLPPDTFTRISADMDDLKEQLGGWLSRISASLLGTGAAVLSRTGDLIEQNPGKTVGVFAAYMAVSNFYASWFLPEIDEIDDVEEGVEFDAFLVPDEATLDHEHMLDEVTDVLEEEPEFFSLIRQLVSQSEYLDPTDDPQLVEDIQAVLQQPFPLIPDMAYEAFLDEVIQQSTLDAQDKSDVEMKSDQQQDAPEKVLAFSDPFGASVHSTRHRRDAIDSDSVGEVIPKYSVATKVIEAVLRILQAEKPLLSKDEIAPGVTVQHAADKVVSAFESAQKIVDPVSFIVQSIESLFKKFSSSSDIKAGVNSTTPLLVTYVGVKLTFPFVERPHVKQYTLGDLCTGAHLRGSSVKEVVEVSWPEAVSLQLREAITSANFQKDYMALIEELYHKSDVKELRRLIKEKELETAVQGYLSQSGSSIEGKEIARDFLSGKLQARVAYSNSRKKTTLPINDAIYISGGPDYGLLVLLKEQKVFEMPRSWPRDENMLVNFMDVKKIVSQRLSIYDAHGRVDADYHHATPYVKGSRFYWWYEPILPGGPGFDVIDILHKIQYEKVIADIDTLISTSGERATDATLEIAGELLQALAVAASVVPTRGVGLSAGARAAAALLFGMMSTGSDALRSAIADDPEEAEQHRKAALRGAVLDFAGPLAGKLLGVGLSKGARLRITRNVMRRLKDKKAPSAIVRQFNDIPKWIPPKIRSRQKILATMNRKFNSPRVTDKLRRLDSGPKQAQKLMDQTRVVYFSGPVKGYVYQGFVMRGDMRPPSEVFKKGFKLRTPISDISEVNGKNGGFGGGKDALDMDGRGISTSSYYRSGGMGAFHYGGGRGGYTYLVDARKMEGFDLYKNHNYFSDKPVKLGFRPLEINYGQNIPGIKIVGAYDSAGVFIPNPHGLERSLWVTKPVLVAVPPAVVKPMLQPIFDGQEPIPV